MLIKGLILPFLFKDKTQRILIDGVTLNVKQTAEENDTVNQGRLVLEEVERIYASNFYPCLVLC